MKIPPKFSFLTLLFFSAQENKSFLYPAEIFNMDEMLKREFQNEEV